MPPVTYTARLVQSQTALDELCASVTGATRVGLDTEFARTDTYRPRLCLVQLAGPGGIAFVDVLADIDSSRLWPLLAAPAVTTVLHAAKQDLEVLLQETGSLPARIFDTQVAAALLGHPPQAGYAALVAAEIGLQLDKSQTRTDWSRRPLSPEQLAYAAEDVAHLQPLADQLGEALERRGRLAWAEEDCAALLDPALYETDPEQAWERLGGTPRLPVPAQARVRQLAAWREQRAAESNRPRQWILADAVLMEIAVRAPADLAALGEIPGIAQGLVRRSGDSLLGQLRTAAERLEGGAWDLRQEARREIPDPVQMRRLGDVVQGIAKDLGIGAELLATRRDLTALLRGERDLRPLRGWRRPVVGEALLQAVGG
jgi:ribonuclease D